MNRPCRARAPERRPTCAIDAPHRPASRSLARAARPRQPAAFFHDYEAGTVGIFNNILGDHSGHNLDLPAKTFAGALTQSHPDSDLEVSRLSAGQFLGVGHGGKARPEVGTRQEQKKGLPPLPHASLAHLEYLAGTLPYAVGMTEVS